MYWYKTNYQKVAEFNKAFGRKSGGSSNFSLARQLLEEEMKEVDDALYDGSKEELLKELCDLLYVVYGYAYLRGWDIGTAFNKVNTSNMSKLDNEGKPIYSDTGKVLKGPNYHKPDLSDCI